MVSDALCASPPACQSPAGAASHFQETSVAAAGVGGSPAAAAAATAEGATAAAAIRPDIASPGSLKRKQPSPPAAPPQAAPRNEPASEAGDASAAAESNAAGGASASAGASGAAGGGAAKRHRRSAFALECFGADVFELFGDTYPASSSGGSTPAETPVGSNEA